MFAISINSHDWDWSESEGKRPKPTPLPHMRLWFFSRRFIIVKRDYYNFFSIRTNCDSFCKGFENLKGSQQKSTSMLIYFGHKNFLLASLELNYYPNQGNDCHSGSNWAVETCSKKAGDMKIQKVSDF